MKKTLIVLIVLIVSLLFVSCSPLSKVKDSDDEQNVSEDITIKNFPSSQEFSSMTEAKRNEIKLLAKTFPIHECEEYFSKIIEEYLKTKNAVQLDSLIITEDKLSLIYYQNKKSLRNLQFQVNLKFDDSTNVVKSDFEKEVAQEIFDMLINYSYFTLNVKNSIVYAVQESGTKIDLGGLSGGSEEKLFVEQPINEYTVQTLAFNYADKQSGFVLTKFGIIPETDELLIEYFIDDYFSNSDNEIENLTMELETVCNDIKSILLSDAETKTYILNNNINKLSISFYSNYLEDLYLNFNFDINF